MFGYHQIRYCSTEASIHAACWSDDKTIWQKKLYTNLMNMASQTMQIKYAYFIGE